MAAGTGTAVPGAAGPALREGGRLGIAPERRRQRVRHRAAGLDAALREYDGRPGSPGFWRRRGSASARCEQLPEQIYSAPVPTRAVASFAEDVARAAEGGDEYARTILADAARELAISTCAAAGRLFEPGEEVVVSYAGSVFGAGELIAAPFRQEVEARLPGSSIVEPEGDPLAGALLLAELAEELPDEPGILRKWR